MDNELLEKLFGFCYARTNDSYEAQELCSDIIFELVKAANKEGEIDNFYPFIWRVARNVYADFSEKRRQRSDMLCEGNADEILRLIPAQSFDDEDEELLLAVYRRIAFLTKAYREVMIMFYIDGMSTAQIAREQGTSEGAVRQRLFSARKKIKSEVEDMTELNNRPLALAPIDFEMWGNGNPLWSDPRNVCTRQFSKHIMWLCRKKPMSAAEIAAELNVPTVYVEEELEILASGENGKYGLLRRLDNGKYTINIILLDERETERATGIYTSAIPKLCEIICGFIQEHRDEYMKIPYLNKRVDMNLILWSQVHLIAFIFADIVGTILSNVFFAGIEEPDRPFSTFWYVGKHYGGGHDGIHADNLCGYKRVEVENIYISRIKEHFYCDHNLSTDPQLQLAVRAVNGLDISTLSEMDKEHAAKAIECGYLYREGEYLYTKILTIAAEDRERMFAVSNGLYNDCLIKFAVPTAQKMSELIREIVPEHLMGEWRFVNTIASLPVLDTLVEVLIEKGMLTPPENPLGAEGCWMTIHK